MSSLPVYSQVAEMLNEQPTRAKDIIETDLQPILKLSESGKVHLGSDALKAIKLRPSKVKLKSSSPSPPSPMVLLSFKLNQDHTQAVDLSTELLKELLQWSDGLYYNSTETSQPVLTDKVYDYVKRIYGQRSTGSMDKTKTMVSVSSATGVGMKPVKMRDAQLPIPLRSLDNIYMGEGDVQQWQATHEGPYHLSAKMDGTSALWHKGVLYTRGDATVGRNISHIATYLNLPKGDVGYAVRGEIVIDREIFNSKYKDKPSKTGAVRKINRNSVAGALGSVTNIDTEFLSDLTFVAYEIITPTQMQMKPSEQFARLRRDGFTVAAEKMSDTLSDSVLSDMYNRLVNGYNYEVDGVVVHTDHSYVRESDKNPDYAKAYKEALAQDVAVTRVKSIEWNPSQYGYLMPTIIYDPVIIGGVTLQRATAHNAREVQKLGLGPGALIEVVYRAKVNPQVNRVIEAVPPDMPKMPYVWVANDSGEQVNIKFNESEASEAGETVMDTIKVKRIHKFLTEIGAKGVGETTVEKIYKTGILTIGAFINMERSAVLFLGQQISQNIIASIKEAMDKVDLPTLMASSKVFGRGLGVKKFTKVFEQYPDFASTRHSKQQYMSMFKTVDGFADKTASLAAEGMEAFWEFIDNELTPEIYQKIIKNTASSSPSAQSSPSSPLTSAQSPISGKNIYLTGTREPELIALIQKHGGTLQATFTGATHILLRKDADYINRKTEDAEKKGIQVLTVREFKELLN